MDRKKIERRIMAEIHIIVFLPVSLIILMRIISSFTMKAVIVVVIVYISFLQLKKLRFLCRKLETYLNKDVRHYFNEIEYEVNQISDYKLINDFQTSELFELKIKSINTKRNKKFLKNLF